MQNLVAHMLEEDFVVSDRATTLPLPEHPALLGYLLVAACDAGSAELTVRDAHCRIAAETCSCCSPSRARRSER